MITLITRWFNKPNLRSNIMDKASKHLREMEKCLPSQKKFCNLLDKKNNFHDSYPDPLRALTLTHTMRELGFGLPTSFVLWLFKSALLSSAAEGHPFPRGTSRDDSGCHTGIVPSWSRLCGESSPKGRMKGPKTPSGWCCSPVYKQSWPASCSCPNTATWRNTFPHKD